MTSFDRADARRLAELSDIAYAGADEAPDAARAIGADDATLIDAGSTECLVARFGSDVFTTFRGTEIGAGAVIDLFRDASVKLRTSIGIVGRVHDGFATGVEKAATEVGVVLSAWIGVDGFLKIGGHSKGGGEALIFARWLHSTGWRRTSSVHVFGSPAVGDREFAESFERTLGGMTWRHVFRSDAVARAPWLLRALRKYRTVGRLAYHSPGRAISFSPGVRYWADSVRAFSRLRGGEDHSIDNYIGGLR